MIGARDLDLGAALHCARVTLSAHRICPPTWLTNHLQQLEAMSVRGPESEPAQPESEWIDTDQAAAILGHTARHVRRIHADLDGRQIAGRWAFDRTKVTEYAQQADGQNRHDHAS